MIDTNSPGLILLTYKGKVLLMHKQKGVLDEEQHPWCLIGGLREKTESFEETLQRRVKKETGVKVENVEFVSELCYRAELTDDNVNQMQRQEFQLLDFFTPRELSNLFLANSTQKFIAKHVSLINHRNWS